MTQALVKPVTPDRLARIVAVVRPVRLDAVMAALQAVGPRDVLIEQVRGYGRQKGHLNLYEEGIPERGALEGGFLPKVRLEFTVPAERVQPAVDAIRGGARSGRIGDGKIFIHELEAAGP